MKWRVLLICLLIANSLAGCEGVEKKKENPNVLFISIDTLRKDHLGIYGYDRPTSPQIDALAKSGIVFDNMISTSSWTLPAHASMLTGKYPAFHGLQDDGVKLAPSVPTIAEYYKKRGYHTMAVVSHVYVSSEFGLERGFDIFDDSLIEGGARNPIAEEVVDNFLYLADKMPAKKYFGFIHFFDPHDDYTAPPPFNAKFTNPAYTGDINGTIQSMLKYYFKEQEMPETDRQQLIGHYDEEIAYVDSQIGRLLKELKRRGMLDNTVIILTSDHGEEFKDHGQLGHGRTLFGEQLHVPLIIVGYPSVTPGSRNGDLVSSIDFYPTLVNLIGGSNSQHFQGRPIIDNEGINNRFVVAETIRYGFEIKSIRQGRFKLIYELNSGKHFYYDLKSDPFEMKPMHNDPTGGELRSALVDYTSFADSGWHLKLIALENSIQLNAVVETNGRFLQPRYYFTKNIGGAIILHSI
jgi:arylsulfatase A-like enzyme